MASGSDGETSGRRRRIADAGIWIVAEQGVRSLTHRAVDRRLGLPAGSTSFYARTRRALLALLADELAARARTEFNGSGLGPPTPDSDGDADMDLEGVADGISRFVDQMLTEHRHDIAARYALALEVRDDDELRARLAAATFSVPAAEGLMRALRVREPVGAAADLVSLLEGLLLDHVLGRRAATSSRQRRAGVRRSVLRFLQGLAGEGTA
ncbi:MAG: TetR/AcrR family transcriptional regulator [Motilibacteraceae bacterium]